MRVEGLAEPQVIALEEIRVGSRLGDTTRSLTFCNGARGETEDNDAVDRLAARIGQGSMAGWVYRLESSWRWALATLAVLILLTVAGFKWGIPALARRTAHLIPPQMAYDLGQGSLATLDTIAFEPSLLASDEQARLTDAFEDMAASYPDLPLSLQFRSGVPANAFALPDGTVIVTDALVELAANDEQVLAVLAHEIGHVHHRHALRMALESSTAALLISTLAGDISALTSLSAMLPAIVLEASYSRDHEWEADTFALAHLQTHGIDPLHFAEIMRLLEDTYGPPGDDEGDDAGTLEYLASHPPTPSRIRRFEAMAFVGEP